MSLCVWSCIANIDFLHERDWKHDMKISQQTDNNENKQAFNLQNPLKIAIYRDFQPKNLLNFFFAAEFRGGWWSFFEFLWCKKKI